MDGGEVGDGSGWPENGGGAGELLDQGLEELQDGRGLRCDGLGLRGGEAPPLGLPVGGEGAGRCGRGWQPRGDVEGGPVGST